MLIYSTLYSCFFFRLLSKRSIKLSDHRYGRSTLSPCDANRVISQEHSSRPHSKSVQTSKRHSVKEHSNISSSFSFPDPSLADHLDCDKRSTLKDQNSRSVNKSPTLSSCNSDIVENHLPSFKKLSDFPCDHSKIKSPTKYEPSKFRHYPNNSIQRPVSVRSMDTVRNSKTHPFNNPDECGTETSPLPILPPRKPHSRPASPQTSQTNKNHQSSNGQIITRL